MGALGKSAFRLPNSTAKNAAMLLPGSREADFAFFFIYLFNNIFIFLS